MNAHLLNDWELLAEEPAPFAVGDTLTVIAKYKYEVSGRNDVGGTDSAPNGIYRVKLERIRWDYECGYRCAGILLDAKDVTTMFEVGHTMYGPKLEQWNPAMVYFHSDSAKRMKPSGAILRRSRARKKAV